MTIKFNEKIYNLFKEYNISTKTNDQCRFKVGDVLNINNSNAFLEEYTAILVSNNIYQLGSYSYSWSPLMINIEVGRYCSIGPNLKFYINAHYINTISTSSFTYDKNFSIFKNSNSFYNKGEFKTKEHKNKNGLPFTKIEDDVWIGADVTISAGITIGTGAIIGTKALVTKDVPPYAIVGGVPAKVIRYRFDEITRMRLLKSNWWKYNFSDFKGIDLELDINKYLDQVEERINNNIIKTFIPRKLYFKEIIDTQIK